MLINIDSIDVLESFKTKPADLDFVFGGLHVGDVGALISQSGAGKSFLALNIAIAVATGVDLTGGALDVRQTGKVAYLNAEDRRDILESRLHSIGKLLSNDAQHAAAENIVVQPVKGMNMRVMDENGRIEKAGLAWLINESKGMRLVILDTLRRFHLADENQSGAMACLLGALEYASKVTGATYLYLHHITKASIGAEYVVSRGSSVLVDNARFQANLVHMTSQEAKRMKISNLQRQKFLKLMTSKSNYKEHQNGSWLYRNDEGVLIKPDFNRVPRENDCDESC